MRRPISFGRYTGVLLFNGCVCTSASNSWLLNFSFPSSQLLQKKWTTSFRTALISEPKAYFLQPSIRHVQREKHLWHAKRNTFMAHSLLIGQCTCGGISKIKKTQARPIILGRRMGLPMVGSTPCPSGIPGESCVRVVTFYHLG